MYHRRGLPTQNIFYFAWVYSDSLPSQYMAQEMNFVSLELTLAELGILLMFS